MKTFAIACMILFGSLLFLFGLVSWGVLLGKDGNDVAPVWMYVAYGVPFLLALGMFVGTLGRKK